MNHDAKKNVCPFMRMRSVCIALIAAVTFFGCKQNMGNESKKPAPAVQKFALTFSVDGGNGFLEAKVDGTKINSGDQVEKGKTVVFTAVPANAATHEVDAWTVSKGAFEQGTGEKGSTTASLKVTDAAAVTVKFKPTLTDQEKVDKAKEALKVYFQNGDTEDNISSTRLSLPMNGLHDTKISWKSSDEAIIKIKKENEWNCYGSITRPEENTQVTLTATITRGDASATKSFTVTIRGTNEDAVISAAEQAVKSIPSFVTKDTHIQLKTEETVFVSNGSSSSSVKVDIKWNAKPPEFISDSDGTVTPHETEIKKVTLTATAKKGKAESSKNIEVTVYPKNNEPNLQTVVESIVNGIPTQINADIQLPQSPSGYKLTWSSSNDSILKIAGNSGHIGAWDVVDRTVTLTATLKKNAAGEAATKEITIKAREKFGDGNNGGTYEFDGDKLTLCHGDGEPAAIYHVEKIDANAKTITATLERIIADGSLVEPEAAQQIFIRAIEEIFDRQISVLLLQQKPLVTLRDIRNALEGQFGLPPSSGTEEELKDFFEGLSREVHFKMTYEEFAKKTRDEQSTALKEILKRWQISYYYKIWGLDETVPITEAEKKVKSSIRSYANDQLESAKKPHIYYYLIKKDSLYTNVQYSIGTSWFRQPGEYRVENPSPDIASIEISGAFKMVTIGIKQQGSGGKEEFVARSYNGSTSFTAEARGEADKKITVAITGEDKDAHTLSVQISGAASFTGTLTFSGRAIPSNWFYL